MENDEIVLLLFGNFNPITNMHLRMFELAKDYLTDTGFRVHKGVISPFEITSSANNLISIEHRVSMIKHALVTSEWIQLSTGHCERFDLPTISSSLQHHQTVLELILRNSTDGSKNDPMKPSNTRVVVKLLCGADIFLCLGNSNSVAELQNILINHGIVVVTRAGFDIESIIYETDVYWMHRKNIFVVKDHIENQISSRKIRQAVSRGQSIKYLVSDNVMQYIQENNLYSVFDEESTLTAKLNTTRLFLDSLRTSTWHSQLVTCSSTSDSLTCTLTSLQKSKALQRNRKCKAHFKNSDRSNLIEIPLTKDGVIQIIADKETNL